MMPGPTASHSTCRLQLWSDLMTLLHAFLILLVGYCRCYRFCAMDLSIACMVKHSSFAECAAVNHLDRSCTRSSLQDTRCGCTRWHLHEQTASSWRSWRFVALVAAFSVFQFHMYVRVESSPHSHMPSLLPLSDMRHMRHLSCTKGCCCIMRCTMLSCNSLAGKGAAAPEIWKY